MSVPDRFSDLRVLRWFDRIDAAMAGEQVGPIRANIDLTNLCTHRCGFCEPIAFREETIRDKTHTLSLGVVSEVLADLVAMDCRCIVLSGGGEPTVHPQFDAVMRMIADSHIRTWVVTHGGFIDKWMDSLLLADHIRVSLDASNEEQHLQMHHSRRGEFDKICAGIRSLCVRRNNRSPEVGIAYILSGCNSGGESIGRVLDFASSAGVDFVHFRPLSDSAKPFDAMAWEQKREIIVETAQEFPKVNVFPLGKRGRDVFTQREFEVCYASMTLAVIGANGDVSACCDRRDIKFGNVNQQSFKSIWLSHKHRVEAENIVPKLCTSCVLCNYNRAVEKYVMNNEALPELP